MIGVTGFETPIYLLDTALPENAPDDRLITDRLYGGGPRERLSQEAVLGLAGRGDAREPRYSNSLTIRST